MSTHFTPSFHPSEGDAILDRGLYLDMNSANANRFMVEVLELRTDAPIGGESPVTFLVDRDVIHLRAAMLDIVDPHHVIEGYWSHQASAFLDICEWADRKGRDVVWY